MKKNKLAVILKYVLLALAVAINVFIIVSGFIDGEGSAKEAAPVINTVEHVINTVHPGAITEANKAVVDYDLRKLFGHFALCGVSGILSTLTFIVFLQNTKLKKLPFSLLFSTVFGFLISLASEAAQLVHPDRGSSFNDVLIDFSGYLIATLFVFLIIILLKYVMVENKEKSKR